MSKSYSWGLYLLFLTGGLGYVVGAIQNREKAVQEEDSISRDEETLAPVPAWRRPEMPMRDAVAAPAPAVFPAALPSAAVAARAPMGLMQGLIASPMQFIAEKTLLGKAEGFSGFMQDRRRVERYVNHPLIKSVLDNPALLKTLLGNPAVIQGFLASPAMRDQRTVSALAKSPLMKELVKTPGVRSALTDPVFMQKVFLNPQMMSWLAANPGASGALTQMRP